MATPAVANEDAIKAAWLDWLGAGGIGQSALAITYQGAVVSVHGSGMSADRPVPIASLSKAVTGACVLSLIDDSILSYDTTLGEAFSDRPDLLPAGQSEQAAITVEALLTHTSGLDFDRTQSVINPVLWGGGDIDDRITALALARPLGAPVFFYNNENYAILGRVIAEATGQPVADVCRARVLDGLTSAGPDPRNGGALAWGGWNMTVVDYARFATRLTPQKDWPSTPLNGGAQYGPGVFVRDTDLGTNIWHFGAFCVLGLNDFGSYFYVLDNGWGVAVWYDVCVSTAQALALDGGLARAASSSD
ncbi:serine hydrolase domain-containing protein [Pseudooctadecabacter jejudonensis]|uniref:serine hydrolase domain-containing protein n=1 Tax=Pseudooctadecabacter jejudonensis TaxID=1391910 RepID=UPI001F2DDF13|nr:serine hydrolase domain-containing protein [Pseudooctadecabacter jejudonensis]